ncbi:hypothetical protein AOLI_G00304860 [Acnodon oligacanthus]
MTEDSLFASDYDGPCPLCEEEGERPYLGLRVSERERKVDKEREEAELKREKIKGDKSVGEKRKENAEKGKAKEAVVEQKQELKVGGKTDEYDYEYEHGEEETDESIAEKLKVKEDKSDGGKDTEASPPLDGKRAPQLDSGCPVNLVMMCEESVERCVSEELMLCPSKTLTLPQLPSLSLPSLSNPLPLTVPPSNPPLLPLQTQPMAQTKQTQAPAQMPGQEALCPGNHNNSPSAEPKTLVPPGQLEVTLRQVYTTRRYTRFTSRPTPLLPLPSVCPDNSSQPLPYITSTSLLPPAPKKKTRTSYSSDQLEELERVFRDDHYPDAEKRKEIAMSVGVTPQRVMVWFQNRRAKWRKTSKTTAKKPPVSRAPAPALARAPAPVHRAPVFTAPTIAPIPSQTGNALPSYSALFTSCTSPPDPSCVDGGNVCISQGGPVDYKLPLMQSPPPLRRASLPFFAAYNPPTHTLSVLLDTPEHSEPQPLSLHTETGFDYDGIGCSAKLESVISGPGNRAQAYQISTFPQQSSALFPQQTNSLLGQQGNNIIPQQPTTLLPQYSHLSYLTPSPYLTPNPSEGTTSSCLPLNPGTTSSLMTCTNGGHAYFKCQNGNQILLQPGVQALQTYPWASDVYGHTGHVPHAKMLDRASQPESARQRLSSTVTFHLFTSDISRAISTECEALESATLFVSEEDKEMSGKQSLCCHVHTATRVSAIFYLVYNLLVAMDLTVGIIRKTDPLTVSYTDMKLGNGYHAFDISTNFMMLVLMSFSSVLVLLSHRKGPVCTVPFVLFMFLDVALSLLSLFAAPWGLPGTPTYRDALRLALKLKGGAKLEVEELSQVTMIFGVLFVLYILLKVYMLQVSMRSFYALRENWTPSQPPVENSVRVKLPSYDEALKMKADSLPPAYQEP